MNGPADGSPRGARVVLVGIDGFSPERMDRWVDEGELPAIAAVARAGVRVPLVSTLPACTPVAWATVATGAPPSVTGIAGFLVHQPGRRLDERVGGCYVHRCRAQPIWEAATRAGRRACVVKFPLSYPSSTATFRLDGAAGWGGLRCFHEAASSAVSALDPEDGVITILPDPEPWAGEDASAPPAFRGTLRLPSLWSDAGLVLHLAVDDDGEGGARVRVADAPDPARVLATLAAGEWSAPLHVHAPGRRGEAACAFRVKALACEARPPQLRLLNTTVHERFGHAAPEETWLRLEPDAGPIEEQTEPSLVFRAGLDVDTQLEVFRLNAEWLERACAALLHDEPWDLFMVQVHLVDWAHHLLQGMVDPRHPEYDPEQAPRYEDALLEAYRMADRLVAAVAAAAGPGANMVVMGDHGQDVLHTTFHVNEWLASRGWLAWEGDGDAVDWTRTRVYATGNYLHFNRLGREPTGITTPSECDRLRTEVVDGLLALADPRTGGRPVLIAGERNEFEWLGAGGPEAGDVVFCLRPGYGATNGRGPILRPTVPLKEFTSGHDHFWPLDPAIHTRLFAAGPAFRRGYRRERAAHLVDVAPTLSAVLGMAPPAHAEGRVLSDLLAAPAPAPAPDAVPDEPATLTLLEVL